MRILYFSRDYTTHDRRFLARLARSRHEIWFLRLEDDGIPYEMRDLPEGIRTVEWEGGRQRIRSVDEWLRLMPAFQTVLGQVRPDLVHAGPVQSCGWMTALAEFHPFLVMSWGSDILVDADRDPMWHWITTYTLQHSNWLLCDCDAVRARVQRWVDYAGDRIVQFPWGIDLARFTPGPGPSQVRRDLDWQDARIVLSTRSWENIYGIDTVLAAFSQAHRQDARLRLLLLGHGSLAPRVERFIAEHDLDDLVHRPGMVSHASLDDYFRSADVYLSCTHSDGSSISLLEALAMGLPVVVTDAPGNREWVVPGENGWVAGSGDVEGFAEALLQATALDQPARAEIAIRNRRVAEERADWEVNFPKLLTAYEQIENQYASRNR